VIRCNVSALVHHNFQDFLGPIILTAGLQFEA